MSQCAKRKYWVTLQVILLIGGLIGCGINPVKSIHPSVGTKAKTLSYKKTLDVIGLGPANSLIQVLAGNNVYDLQRPYAIDVRGDFVYIVDSKTNLVLQYNRNIERASLVHFKEDYFHGDVMGLYLASDFSFYVTDTDGRQVLHFSPEGHLLKTFRHDPNMSRPISVSVIEETGHVLVADELYSHIVGFSQSGEPLYGLGGRGTGPGKFRIITDMIRTKDGFLVGDRIELRVQRLDKNGQYVTHFGEGIVSFPTAIAEDDYGRVYVADKADSRIKVFKRGKLIDTIGKNGYGLGEFRYIGDMKYYDNLLYVADSLNGRIQVFNVLPERNVTSDSLAKILPKH